MTNHSVVIAGGGPTGLMLAGELALAGVDVSVVERRPSQELSGARALGIHQRCRGHGVAPAQRGQRHAIAAVGVAGHAGG